MKHGWFKEKLRRIYAVTRQGAAGPVVQLAIVSGGFCIGAVGGLANYLQTGHVAPRNWARILAAHCFSNGRSTILLNALTRVVRPAGPKQEKQGLLGLFPVSKQNEIVAALDRDGYYVFPQRLDEAFCNQIQTFALEADTIIETSQDLRAPLERYNRDHPVSRTYKIREQDSINSEAVQKLVADPVFAAIAEAYLGTRPVVGGINIWWSAVFGNRPGDDAAQLFHFDFDAPPAWLKLFVYITDVGPDSGPHVYVRGSHKPALKAAREFRSRGYKRIEDAEMETAFGANALVEITGGRGTVFMADTRGFHKGKAPQGGDRLIVQLLYCSPVFSDRGLGPLLPETPDPLLAAALKDSPALFDRFQKWPGTTTR